MSNLTGALVDSSMSAPQYWVSHVRECVRFADGIQTLREAGASRFVVAGPDGGLSALISEVLDADTDAVTQDTRVVAILGRKRSERETLLTAVAAVDTTMTDVGVAWKQLWTNTSRVRVQLPSYAFQRRHYWLESNTSSDPGVLGLPASSHPLIGTVISTPETGAMIATARLSLTSHPWLGDHVVSGEAVVPGAVFVEWISALGGRLSCDCLQQLLIHSPLVLPQRASVAVRIAVDPPGENGSRDVRVYSRPDAPADVDMEWVLYAQALLVPGTAAPVATDAWEQWPPRGSEPVALDGLYDRYADSGYRYGSAFQALRAVWRDDTDVYLEAALPESSTAIEQFVLHPALLEAIVQASAIADPEAPPQLAAAEDIRVHAVGATAVRARIRPDGSSGGVSAEVVDQAGQPVMNIETLAVRRMHPQGRLTPPGRLSIVRWSPRTADIGEPLDTCTVLAYNDFRAWSDQTLRIPGVVVLDLRGTHTLADTVSRAHLLAHETLGVVQAWLENARFAESRLLVLTAGAVAAEPVSDIAAATVWGLVRSAQSEHPGRIILVDSDSTADLDELAGRVVATGEPQVVVRGDVVHVARLMRLPTEPMLVADERLSTGTVVVTGGTGGLGALVARHLVRNHGVRSLVLGSRRGRTAPGTSDLVTELTELGARVAVTACDVSTRDGVQALLAAVPEDARLAGVVHAAGVLDDGVVSALTPDRLDSVLAAKADAAWWLHEATRELDLSLFVLYSSVAGVFGGAGQGNYAAANTFLDALAQYRRDCGLAAVSIAWGLWDSGSGMGARLRTADTTRCARDGM
ncbi:type I polyketide synthase, partial [Nocardia sp. NPDC058497]|uniref:type I polyketide synthase n=1 Tax=Nocardia sp. NPDC058497 TaxID=3346529 RepID=UPI003647B174